MDQRKYSIVVERLDDVMDAIRGEDGTEEEAREWLKDFVANHYFQVWRKMQIAV